MIAELHECMVAACSKADAELTMFCVSGEVLLGAG